MSIFSLRDDGLVVSQDSVSHFTTSTPPPSGDACDVLILHAPQTISAVSRHLRNSIWSYVYPGKVDSQFDINCSLITCSRIDEQELFKENSQHLYCICLSFFYYSFIYYNFLKYKHHLKEILFELSKKSSLQAVLYITGM